MIKKYIIFFAFIFCTSSVSSMDKQSPLIPVSTMDKQSTLIGKINSQIKLKGVIDWKHADTLNKLFSLLHEYKHHPSDECLRKISAVEFNNSDKFQIYRDQHCNDASYQHKYGNTKDLLLMYNQLNYIKMQQENHQRRLDIIEQHRMQEETRQEPFVITSDNSFFYNISTTWIRDQQTRETIIAAMNTLNIEQRKEQIATVQSRMKRKLEECYETLYNSPTEAYADQLVNESQSSKKAKYLEEFIKVEQIRQDSDEVLSLLEAIEKTVQSQIKEFNATAKKPELFHINPDDSLFYYDFITTTITDKQMHDKIITAINTPILKDRMNAIKALQSTINNDLNKTFETFQDNFKLCFFQSQDGSWLFDEHAYFTMHRSVEQQRQDCKEALSLLDTFEPAEQTYLATTIQSLFRKNTAQKIVHELREKKAKADAQAKAERNAQRNANKKKKLAQEKAEKIAEQTRLNDAAATTESLTRKNAAQKIVHELRENKAQAYAQAKICEDAKRDKVPTKKMTAQTQAIIKTALLNVDAQEKEKKETTDIATSIIKNTLPPVDAQEKNTTLLLQQKATTKTKKTTKTEVTSPTSVVHVDTTVNTSSIEIPSIESLTITDVNTQERNAHNIWLESRKQSIKKLKAAIADQYATIHRGEQYNKDERTTFIESNFRAQFNKMYPEEKIIKTIFEEYIKMLSRNPSAEQIATFEAAFQRKDEDVQRIKKRLAWYLLLYPEYQESMQKNIVEMHKRAQTEEQKFHFKRVQLFHTFNGYLDTNKLDNLGSTHLANKGTISCDTLRTTEETIKNHLVATLASTTDTDWNAIPPIISNLLQQARIQISSSLIEDIIDSASLMSKHSNTNIHPSAIDKVMRTVQDTLSNHVYNVNKFTSQPQTDDQMADHINIHMSVIKAYFQAGR